jgi:two-component system, OmpR family, response regulator VicR
VGDKMQVLLVEDDRAIANGLAYSLKQEGYQLDIANTVASAKQLLAAKVFSMILLDIGLPDGDGYELCTIAKQNPQTAVIFLTAYEDEGNIVMGLDLGADDYITKPFRIRELLSRMKSVLRRYQTTDPIKQILQYGSISIYPQQAKVYKNNTEIFLSPIEYRLLLTLMNHINLVLTRDQLLDGIWDVAQEFINENTLTVYIKRLRSKIEDDPQNPSLITTVRGFGYRIGE